MLQTRLTQILFIIFCLFVCNCFAEDSEIRTFDIPEKKGDCIQGIALVPNKSSLLKTEELKKVRGVQSFGVNIPEGRRSLALYLAPIALDEPFTLLGLIYMWLESLLG